ncbi:hypothetical protein ERJ75_001045000 [Trypanosoma vivax]|uniref:Uncharacterized protein n=1 Tax=Trypanosoma vivax (strain Y486) TaxID=1055687 RepID=F9WSE1_TRYVY|nr:hypothetical protein TRVL_03267 [Trypanosoma vivax]KAH8610985.1 hypothetical protein ERJ75_001045000 [Trypanosoma vivax]CCD20480.1 hypothetical protein, conserved in T. vivax [Trypanosoma vivax Y486]|eukprot:CCD20480.1 hypothetical protein, conserved in T. vivax [Trypanosoma vivax Y486]
MDSKPSRPVPFGLSHSGLDPHERWPSPFVADCSAVPTTVFPTVTEREYDRMKGRGKMAQGAVAEAGGGATDMKVSHTGAPEEEVAVDRPHLKHNGNFTGRVGFGSAPCQAVPQQIAVGAGGSFPSSVATEVMGVRGCDVLRWPKDAAEQSCTSNNFVTYSPVPYKDVAESVIRSAWGKDLLDDMGVESSLLPEELQSRRTKRDIYPSIPREVRMKHVFEERLRRELSSKRSAEAATDQTPTLPSIPYTAQRNTNGFPGTAHTKCPRRLGDSTSLSADVEKQATSRQPCKNRCSCEVMSTERGLLSLPGPCTREALGNSDERRLVEERWENSPPTSMNGFSGARGVTYDLLEAGRNVHSLSPPTVNCRQAYTPNEEQIKPCAMLEKEPSLPDGQGCDSPEAGKFFSRIPVRPIPPGFLRSPGNDSVSGVERCRTTMNPRLQLTPLLLCDSEYITAEKQLLMEREALERLQLAVEEVVLDSLRIFYGSESDN